MHSTLDVSLCELLPCAADERVSADTDEPRLPLPVETDFVLRPEIASLQRWIDLNA
jgi:hypothetical protein